MKSPVTSSPAPEPPAPPPAPRGDDSTAPHGTAIKSPRSPKRAWRRPVLLLAAVVAMVLLARMLNLGERVAALQAWIDSLGTWGPAVYALIYIAATVAAVPGSALSLAAGALFGSVVGVIVVSVSATTGAALCFLISRYVARDAAAAWLAKNPTFHRLDQLTERRGAWIVAVARLVPLFPFNVLNYGFGLTRVRFWTYVFFSWLCMIPGTVALVVFGDGLFQALAEGEIPWLLLAIGVSLLVLLSILGYTVRRKLRREEGRIDAAGDAPDDRPARTD